MSAFPVRIHVIIARNAHKAIVIRRGPSKKVCTIGWNMESDTFQVGQWLQGRIYERRCDLSPNGAFFIYFALNARWDSEVKGSWTAISRTPYLKAVGLWTKGDAWDGGGLFVSDSTFWINGRENHEELRIPDELTYDRWTPSVSYGGECPGVYYHRLQRDGWMMKFSSDKQAVFEKQVNADLILRKVAHATINHPVGRGCYFDEHELVYRKPNRTVEFPSWEWADIDRNRIVYAEHGKLFAQNVRDNTIEKAALLFNGNELEYKRLKAPY